MYIAEAETMVNGLRDCILEIYHTHERLIEYFFPNTAFKEFSARGKYKCPNLPYLAQIEYIFSIRKQHTVNKGTRV